MRRTRSIFAVSLGVAALALGGLLAPAGATAATPLKIMPLGASMTWGTNSTDGNGYRKVLHDRLTNDLGLSVDFIGSQKAGNMADSENEGHPGYRIDSIASWADQWLRDNTPDVVVLNAGTNDTIQDHDLATAPDRESALIDQIIKDVPGVTVIFSTLMPSTNTTNDARVNAFNAKMPAIAAAKQAQGKKVYLADIHAVLAKSDIGPDTIHPTDAGYVKIANSFAETMSRVLAPTRLGVLKGAESGRCVDIPGYSQTNGVKPALWDCNNGTNQRFVAGANKSLQVFGGKCLDANGGATANGTAVILWDCHGGTNQQWTLNANGSIQGVASGRCLDATGHGTANGTLLVLWDCNGGTNQKWSRS